MDNQYSYDYDEAEMFNREGGGGSVLQMSKEVDKLFAATAKVTGLNQIGKSGKYDGYGNDKYSYSSTEDVLGHYGAVMSENGLSLMQISSTPTYSFSEKNKHPHQCELTVVYILTHTSGQWLLVQGSGFAWDYSSDKALYKAITMAQKYVVRTLFSSASNENDGDAKDEGAGSPKKEKQQRKTTKQQPKKQIKQQPQKQRGSIAQGGQKKSTKPAPKADVIPKDFVAWAMKNFPSKFDNEFEAKNSFKKCMVENSGKPTAERFAAWKKKVEGKPDKQTKPTQNSQDEEPLF